MIVFDIETASLPWEQLSQVVEPFDPEKAVPHPGEFNPQAVAVGNLKDPTKIAAKVDEARGKYLLQVQTLDARRICAQLNHMEEAQAKAALSPLTGCVKAIGMLTDSEEPDEATLWYVGLDERFKCEADLLNEFWSLFFNSPTVKYVGHNIFNFDLPFLVRRSWLLGLSMPAAARQGRNWSNQFVDTMERWSLGCRGGNEYVKLEVLAKALGLEGKPDDCSGADFARMFDAGGEEREKALDYLRGDLVMVRGVAEAMGIL